MIGALAEQYLGWLSKDLDSFSQSLAEVERDPADATEPLKEIFGICHNIKGQGAAFGYELATELGKLVCGITRNKTSLTEIQLNVVQQCLVALRLIIDENIRGDGGQLGREILVRLQAMSLSA